jgi:hypothetical protein
MHDQMDSELTPRPLPASPHEAFPINAASPGNDNLRLVTDPASDDAHVEEAFFAQGEAEEQAALNHYAANPGLVVRHGFNFKLGRQGWLWVGIAGTAAILLIGTATVRHLVHRTHSLAQAPASVPAAPAVAPAVAVAVPVPIAPAAQLAVTKPNELAAAQPMIVESEGATASAKPSVPPAAAPAAAQEVPAPAPPTLAAEPPAAKPATPVAQVALAASATAEAKVAGKAADLSNSTVDACREAVKKRDAKAVSAACEAALEVDATLARPLLAFAKVQFERGKSGVGATWARKVLHVDNTLADAYLIVGAAEQEARRPSAARTAYQRYLELAPRGPYANDIRSTLKSL